MTTYMPFDGEQPFLLPPDVKDWLPADDIAHFVVAAVAAFDTAKSGGLIMAAIAPVFTISYVANLLGADEDCSRKTAACGSMASTRMAYPPSPRTA